MNEKRPLVSIWCLCYNHEKYIRECLDGFVMQRTDFAFEAIIHDDASTDSSADIIHDYAERYPDIIKPIFEKENQYSKADGSLDRIFQRSCTGKYIALCEGDDYWTDPLKLQKQVDFLEANPEYSMCFHNVDVLTEKGCELSTTIYEHLQNKDYSGSEIISHWTVPTCSVVFRSTCRNHIPTHPDFKIGDNVLFLTCAKCGRTRCINEKMGVYRRNGNGWTAQSTVTIARKFIIHYEAMKECFPDTNPQIFDNKLVSFYGLLTFYDLCHFHPEFWSVLRKGLTKYKLRYVLSFFKWSVLSPVHFLRKQFSRLIFPKQS